MTPISSNGAVILPNPQRTVADHPGMFDDVQPTELGKWAATAAIVPGAVAGLATASAFFLKRAGGGNLTVNALTLGPRLAGIGALGAVEVGLLATINWPRDMESGYYSRLLSGAVVGGVTSGGMAALAAPGIMRSHPRAFASLALGAAALGAAIGGGLGVRNAFNDYGTKPKANDPSSTAHIGGSSRGDAGSSPS